MPGSVCGLTSEIKICEETYVCFFLLRGNPVTRPKRPNHVKHTLPSLDSERLATTPVREWFGSVCECIEAAATGIFVPWPFSVVIEVTRNDAQSRTHLQDKFLKKRNATRSYRPLRSIYACNTKGKQGSRLRLRAPHGLIERHGHKWSHCPLCTHLPLEGDILCFRRRFLTLPSARDTTSAGNHTIPAKTMYSKLQLKSLAGKTGHPRFQQRRNGETALLKSHSKPLPGKKAVPNSITRNCLG